MILACSHLVIATSDVERIKGFFEALFEISTHFYHEEFCEFVLGSGFRIAFFKPVGKSARFFSVDGERSQVAYGVTVEGVDKIYQKALQLQFKVSGPPQDHPWGERSFLLWDPDENRWEITQSPSRNGMLVNR